MYLGYTCEVPDEERYWRLQQRNVKKRAVSDTADVTGEVSTDEGSDTVDVSIEEESNTVEVNDTLNGKDGST